jgi:hypothetical protein
MNLILMGLSQPNNRKQAVIRQQRWCGFTYDHVNRLLNADYGEYNTSWTNPASMYDESIDG